MNDKEPTTDPVSPDSNESNEQLKTEPHVVEPANPLPPAQFDAMPEHLKKAAIGAGWNSLMPVQSRTIPYILAGRDLMIQSRTGSGKTGAFLLPILTRINPKRAMAQALVLVP